MVNSPTQPPGARSGRLVRRTTLALSVANVAGALIVFLFLGLVVPVPAEVHNDWGLLFRNLAVFVPGLALAVTYAILRGRRRAAPVWDWYDSGREPGPHERALALRQPLALTMLSGGIWLGALVLFTIVNAFSSLGLAALIAVTVALGGLASCALTYLLSERITRPVIAAALAAGVPSQSEAPGVEARVLLAWNLTAGIPLLGASLLAIAVLAGADVSAVQVAGSVLFLCVVGLGVGLFAMRLTARSIADPIDSVRAALREVQAGNLETEVTVYDGSEVGLLQAGFNHMVGGLRERERLHDLFGRHVGVDVARRALDRGVELGGESTRCAALFVDVTGSTNLGATRPAAEVVELLNRFFGIAIEVVHARGGWVNKFQGDAALCVFGIPAGLDDAPTRALAASRELSDRLAADLPELGIGIGVSWGEVVAGNVGAAERYEYTVIGDPVNESARLCELAKDMGERVLVSEAILDAAEAGEAARWRPGETLRLRGRADDTRVARPIPASAETGLRPAGS